MNVGKGKGIEKLKFSTGCDKIKAVGNAALFYNRQTIYNVVGQMTNNSEKILNAAIEHIY